MIVTSLVVVFLSRLDQEVLPGHSILFLVAQHSQHTQFSLTIPLVSWFFRRLLCRFVYIFWCISLSLLRLLFLGLCPGCCIRREDAKMLARDMIMLMTKEWWLLVLSGKKRKKKRLVLSLNIVVTVSSLVSTEHVCSSDETSVSLSGF